ncbi:MAG TPA: POTRA domain-containing protein, partial [Gammaproteobacteria bacterium]|nr:POTRA domain-containing protein [Gammaproteobacteria bacterium]
MRRVSLALGIGFVGGLLATTSPALAQQPAPAPTREQLEQSGATIRAIYVTVDNIFDPNNPEEDKALYRWANKAHVRTRDSVVRDILLFAPGDKFEARLLDESARTLRARGFIADAAVEPGAYDAASNSVDVNVRVRDSWSLSLDLKLNRKGGQTEWGVGLSDNNLLGTGKTLEVVHESEIDRDHTALGYVDNNVFGSRIQLRTSFRNASDGDRRQLAVERPFYALDTRWSLGGNLHSEERIDTMYDLGEEIDEFGHEINISTLQGGWSRGLVGKRAARWLAGYTSEEHTFSPTTDVPQPLLLPPNRKLVYPWVGWQLVEDDFREMTELNTVGRTEDISLGLNVLASIGFADTSYDSDRNAELLRFDLAKGWEPRGSGLLLMQINGSTRREDVGYRNSQASFSARYYQRNLERHLFLATLSVLETRHLDPENQVLLGGDNGLRGYPIRYQAGESRTILSVEQRFFTDFYPWRLFRVGWAVFADAGRVGGRDPRATPSQGTLYDVGAGLRLASPRASGRNVVHIDLAFPLN